MSAPTSPTPALKNFNLPPQLLPKIKQALDELMDILQNREAEIIEAPGLRKGFAFDLYRKNRRRWRRSYPCVFPNCNNTSITASHSLQEKGPLAAIAENKHVLTPEFSLSKQKNDLIRIGIGEASTFPGFCQEHEQLFSNLEKRRDLSEDQDIALQVFRTICREIVIKRLHIEDAKAFLSAWKKAVNDRGIVIVQEKLADILRHYPGLKPRSVTVQGISWYEGKLQEQIQSISETLHLLENDFLPSALTDIEGRGPNMAHFVVRLEQPLRVCLAGLGTFHVKDGQTPSTVVAVLNVWPTSNSTTISAAVLAIHEKYLNEYMRMQIGRSLGPLEMLETWMVNGTDHWFIKPSVWNRIPLSRRDRILNDMLDTTYSIGEPYPRSIFDELREAMMRLAEATGEATTDLACEEEKLKV